MNDYRRRILVGCAVSLGLHAVLLLALSAFSFMSPPDPGRAVSLTVRFQAGGAELGGPPSAAPAPKGPAATSAREAPGSADAPALAPAVAPTAAPTAASAQGGPEVTPAAAGAARPEPALGGPTAAPDEAQAAAGGSAPGAASGGSAAASGGTGGAGGGAAAAGSGTGGDSGDSVSALAARLGQAVEAAIEARKTYPDAARRRGAQGVVKLRLRVSADGQLKSAKLAASSGSTLLDRAALDLVASVFPVDNPARAELVLVLAVRYSLKD